jgi:hypothetical protein
MVLVPVFEIFFQFVLRATMAFLSLSNDTPTKQHIYNPLGFFESPSPSECSEDHSVDEIPPATFRPERRARRKPSIRNSSPAPVKDEPPSTLCAFHVYLEKEASKSPITDNVTFVADENMNPNESKDKDMSDVSLTNIVGHNDITPSQEEEDSEEEVFAYETTSKPCSVEECQDNDMDGVKEQDTSEHEHDDGDGVYAYEEKFEPTPDEAHDHEDSDTVFGYNGSTANSSDEEEEGEVSGEVDENEEETHQEDDEEDEVQDDEEEEEEE